MFVKRKPKITSTTARRLKLILQLVITTFFFDTFGIGVIIFIYFYLQTFDHFVVFSILEIFYLLHTFKIPIVIPNLFRNLNLKLF